MTILVEIILLAIYGLLRVKMFGDMTIGVIKLKNIMIIFAELFAIMLTITGVVTAARMRNETELSEKGVLIS